MPETKYQSPVRAAYSHVLSPKLLTGEMNAALFQLILQGDI
jgi:hypothetical protein